MTHSSLDSLRLLQFQKQYKGQLSVMGMGQHGQLTRILGKIFGCDITYASLDNTQSTAPGQVDTSTLLDIYRYKSLNNETQIFGLLGHPVDKSLGHIVHNAILEALKINGIYVKIDVTAEQLPAAIKMIASLNFKGLSVTMPLKECVMELVDEFSDDVVKIGATNTIAFKNAKKLAYNTDSIGALQAIEEKVPVKGKKLILLGAGGAAKAIAYEAQKRGAHVFVLNRTLEKAQQISKSIGCSADSLDKMEDYTRQGYDILINCTPVQMPISPDHLLEKAVVMDIISRPKDTQILLEAKKRGCKIVYGYKMWIYQALKQLEIWHGKRIDLTLAKEIADSIFQKN